MEAVMAANNIESDIGLDARVVLKRFFSVLILLVMLVGVAEQSYLTKRDAARALFESLTFTRIAVETRQHIRKIEYGIKNGRELEQYHNLDSILRDIKRISSYITGVYVVGQDDVLLDSLDIADRDSLELRRPRNLTFDGETVYQMSEYSDYFDLFLPIYDTDGLEMAYTIIRLDRDAVYFSTLGLVRQEYTQSVVIVLLLFGIGLIIILKAELKTSGVAILIFTLCFIGLSLDMGLAYSRFRGIAESATIQSVNRIAQLLQSDVDVIRAMGVSPDAIHDQNSWLRQAVRGIPMIHSSSMDSNMQITLTASRTYFNQYSMDLLKSYVIVYTGLFLLGVIAAFVRICSRRRGKRSKENSIYSEGVPFVRI